MLSMKDKIVCIFGSGYAGLPLAEVFSIKQKVIGFDIDGDKVRKLNQRSNNQNVIFGDKPKEISKTDFVLICVPTPVPILMNELTLIFHKMGLNTKLVLEAAARKWIFERKRACLLPSLGGCYRINNFTYSGDAR